MTGPAVLGLVLGMALGLRRGHRRPAALRGQVALVTGGSRGLGLELARELGRRGARVAICARDPETLERAHADLERRGIPVLALAADVSESTTATALVQRVVARFGALDVVVNNAGIITVGPLPTLTRADFEEAMRTNFWGAVSVALAALPFLRKSGDGRVVNIVSIGGKVAVPHLLPYSASKFALAGFSEGLAAEARDAASRAVSLTEELARYDSAYWYDQACSLTLRGMVCPSDADSTTALAVLRKLTSDGFDNGHSLRTDPRLENLRSSADFPDVGGVPK